MFEQIFAYFYRQQLIMRRRPGDLAWIFIHPFISLFSIGILAFFVVQKGAPVNSLMFVFVGVIMWNFYDLVQRAVTYGIAFDIWSSSLKHSFSSGASPRHFIIGNSLFGLYSAFISFVLVGVAAYFAFGFNILLAGWSLLNLIPVFLFAAGAGLMINCLMVSKGEKYMALIWSLTGIVMIFSGVYYPTNVLPFPIADISQAMPSTHSINSMRAAFGYSPENMVSEFLIGFLMSIVYFVVGIVVFLYGLKKGYQNGTITKY